MSNLRRKAAKMVNYGILKWLINENPEHDQVLFDIGHTMESKVEPAVSFTKDEIREMKEIEARDWMNSIPGAKQYKHRVN